MIKDSVEAGKRLGWRRTNDPEQRAVEAEAPGGNPLGQDLAQPPAMPAAARVGADPVGALTPTFLIDNPTYQGQCGIVATGFTTAYLGDERSLREFIVGDHVRDQIARATGSCLLYLINDNYDPLNYRQLRVAVNKDEKLLAQFEHYCGRPIAEIPDPFECHESYSQHFTDALLQRLHSLDIYPVVLDTYQAYRNGYYESFIATTLASYFQITDAVKRRFAPFTIHNLLHVKCSRCQCIDATHIEKIFNNHIQLECSRWYTQMV